MASKITFLIITFFGLVQAQRQGKRLQCPPGVEAGFVLMSFDEIFCKSGQVWDSFQKTCKSGSQLPTSQSDDPFDYDDEEIPQR